MGICGRYGRRTAGHWALHQRTAEWGRDRASYVEIRSTGCGPPAEETPQSGSEETTEEQAAQLQSHSAQGADIKFAQL